MTTSDIIVKSMTQLGYQLEILQLGEAKKSFLHFVAPDGKGQILMSKDSPLYPFATAATRLVCNNKMVAYDFAKYAGVKIPRTVFVDKDDTALEAVEQLLNTRGRVIVKPADSSMSNGLTLNVKNFEGVKTAIQYARQYSEKVIAQEQVTGDEIRFVVVDGKVRAAILRQTPRVVGDGKSTFNDLIEKENKLRKEITDTMVLYPELNHDIYNTEDYDFGNIPKKDEVVELSNATMIKNGASIYNIYREVHSTYTDIVNNLAAKLGKGFVVVDMMLQDYRVASDDNNYAFIEFNLTPALQLFYSCRDGRHFNVAEEYLAPMIDNVVKRDYL